MAKPAEAELSVIVVDRHRLFREGVRELLVSEGIAVAAEAGDAAEAVSLAAEVKPGVALIDLDLPDASGIDATRRIRLVSPRVAAILLEQVRRSPPAADLPDDVPAALTAARSRTEFRPRSGRCAGSSSDDVSCRERSSAIAARDREPGACPGGRRAPGSPSAPMAAAGTSSAAAARSRAASPERETNRMTLAPASWQRFIPGSSGSPLNVSGAQRNPPIRNLRIPMGAGHQDDPS